MIYVDSNIFILAFLAEDKTALLSRRFLERIAGNKVAAFTSVLTWDEIVWAAISAESPKLCPPVCTCTVGDPPNPEPTMHTSTRSAI